MQTATVDCKYIFRPGQISVALSRVRDPKDLAVYNFSKFKCFPQSQIVKDFLSKSTSMLNDNLCCCKENTEMPLDNIDNNSNLSSAANDGNDDDDEDDDDDGGEDRESSQAIGDETSNDYFNNLKFELSSSDSRQCLPTHVDRLDFIRDLYSQHVTLDSPLMKEINKVTDQLMKSINHEETTVFLNFVWNTCSKFLKQNEMKTISASDQRNFTSNWRQFTNSSTFHHCVHFLYSTQSPTTAQLKVARMIAERIKSRIINEASNVLKLHIPYPNNETKPITSQGQSMIRKLGGRAIAKIRKKLVTQSKAALQKGKVNETTEFTLGTLRTLEANYSEISQTTALPETLDATERSQGPTRGLTHITDHAFHFFHQIETVRRNFQSHANLCIFKSAILIETVKHVESNPEIKSLWSNAIQTPTQTEISNSSQIIKDLYKTVIIKFLRVSNNGYRKYLRSNVYAREKELAHRIDILKDPNAMKPDVPRRKSAKSSEVKKKPQSEVSAPPSSSSQQCQPQKVLTETALEVQPQRIPLKPIQPKQDATYVFPVISKRRKIVLPIRYRDGAKENEI